MGLFGSEANPPPLSVCLSPSLFLSILSLPPSVCVCYYVGV